MPHARLRRLTALCTLCGLGASFLVMQSMGGSLTTLLSAERMVELGSEVTVARFEDGYDAPLTARLLSSGFYAGALLGGILWAESKTLRNRLFAVLPVLGSLVYVAIMTTRSALLFSIALFLAARLATAAYRGEVAVLSFGPKKIIAGVLLGAGVFGVFVVAQMIRGGMDDFGRSEQIIDHLGVWFFGHLAAFTQWLRMDGLVAERIDYGQYTFGGVFQLLGLGTRELGVFTQFVSVGGGRQTNVFTAFRGLIMDFGLGGSAFVVCVLGYSMGSAFRSLRRGNVLALPLVAACYAFVLWSHVVSIVTYNTIILSFGVVAGLIAFSGARKSAPVLVGS